MTLTRNLTTTGTYGMESGTDFTDLDGIPNINTAAISRIVVTHNSHIQSLTVGFYEVSVWISLIARIKGALQ